MLEFEYSKVCFNWSQSWLYDFYYPHISSDYITQLLDWLLLEPVRNVRENVVRNWTADVWFRTKSGRIIRMAFKPDSNVSVFREFFWLTYERNSRVPRQALKVIQTRCCRVTPPFCPSFKFQMWRVGGEGNVEPDWFDQLEQQRNEKNIWRSVKWLA